MMNRYMKKTVLKSLVTAFVLLTANVMMAQPPDPPTAKGKAPQQRTESINSNDPVGTATLLMLGLGGAFLGYKLKNNKNEEDNN